MKTTNKLIVSVLGLFISATVLANETAVFDQVFGKGKYKLEFASSQESAIGTIRLRNGWNGGEIVERSSSATIKVNGVIVFKPSDFNQTVESLTRGIPLEPETNTIEIAVNGNPESAIAITISQTPSTGAASLMYYDGGELFVNDETSDIFGAGVLVPEGALEYASAITIAKSEIPLQLPFEATNVGSVIDFGADGLTFNYPVYITLPYEDTNNDGVVDGTLISETIIHGGYFNELTGEWERIPVVQRDYEENTITISTDHFSSYAALANVPSSVDQTTPVVTSGRIIVDGSRIDWPSLYSDGLDHDDYFDKNTTVCPKPGGNLMHTHTVIDDEYVYVILEVHDNIAFSDHDYLLRVDYAEGSNVDQSSIADAMIVVSGDDAITIKNLNGLIGNITFPGVQVASSESTFELRIPKVLFQNLSWFNVVGTEVRPTYTGDQVHETYKILENCDSQFSYPGLMYFSAYTGGTYSGLFDDYLFYLRDQNGASIQDDVVKSFKVTDPSGNDITGEPKSTASAVRRAIYQGNRSNKWMYLEGDVVGINAGAIPERVLGEYSIEVVFEGASDDPSDDFVIKQSFASTTDRNHQMPIANAHQDGYSGCTNSPTSGTPKSIGCWWRANVSTTDPDYTVRPWLRSYDADGVQMRMIDYYQKTAKYYIEVTEEQLRWLGEGACKIGLTVMIQKNTKDYRSYSRSRYLPNIWWKPIVYPGEDPRATGC